MFFSYPQVRDCNQMSTIRKCYNQNDSMIKKYNNHKLQTNQLRLSLQLSIKHHSMNLKFDARAPGVGTPIFFHIRRLGPSINCSPPKKYQNFKHPKKIFEILATPKNIPILYLDLKKDPIMHRNDPQTSPIFVMTPKNTCNHKIFIPPKNIHFSENPQKY